MKVVCVRRLKPNDPGVVYIGRESKGWAGSILGNPFSHLKASRCPFKAASREEAVEAYRRYLWAAMHDSTHANVVLEGKPQQVVVILRKVQVEEAFATWTTDTVLGCWCHPKSCHGDVLVAAWAWWMQQRQREVSD